MNADKSRYKHTDLTSGIIGVFLDVYSELGYGFLECVYRRAMSIALRSKGFTVETELPIQARFRGEVVGEFRADLLINGRAIAELKAAKSLAPDHVAQTLNYLRASVIEVALLLNDRKPAIPSHRQVCS